MANKEKITAATIRQCLEKQSEKAKSIAETIVQETLAKWGETIKTSSFPSNSHSIRCTDEMSKHIEKELLKLGFSVDDSEDMGEDDNIIHFSTGNKV